MSGDGRPDLGVPEKRPSSPPPPWRSLDSVLAEVLDDVRTRVDGGEVVFLAPRVEPPTNDPDEELCFWLCQRLDRCHWKPAIMKLHVHGKIGAETATTVIAALDLGAA